MLSMERGWDYWVVDEEGETYGCYDSRIEAERAIEDLYNSPFISNDTVFGIEME